MRLHRVCLSALPALMGMALSVSAFAVQTPNGASSTPAAALNLQTFATAPLKPTTGRMKCDRRDLIETNVVVERGVDGDTIMVQAESGSYSVRMLGIDTPETHYLGKSQGEWGEKAADRMKKILPPGTEVTLEFNSEGCDKYGRVLAYVFKDGKNINAQMAKEGWAVSYCVGPDTNYCEEIGDYVNKAIKAKKGMFSDPDLELPYDWRRRVSNRGWESYVGNLRTKEVFSPGNNDKVPVGDRVFFMDRRDIHAPFALGRY
ncbi:MAG: thermonuclease family protein [Proteobacteria bacterium]|nr:MAG: thermonuclease family protein [Pseudomonadota bacterium]